MKLDAAFDRFEQAAWEGAVDAYCAGFGALTAGLIPPILKALGGISGCRLLDVACGPGTLAAQAAEQGGAAVGLDFAAAMIAEARRRHPTLELHLGDAQALPFRDNCFDAVAMNFGVLHLSEPERAFCEARRVLRVGGRYAFTVWDLPERAIGFEVMLGAIKAAGDPDVPLPPGPPFFKYADAAVAENELLRAGFASARSGRIGLSWRLPSADAFFETFLHGTARTGAVLRAQSPAKLEAIRAEVHTRLVPWSGERGLTIPMAAVMVVAERE